ncbi:MAG: VCBS repeat-containing protein [Desulfamplus sp.]|nr:VCBS repeat-containing protein [Desulfamplus sp.]
MQTNYMQIKDKSFFRASNRLTNRLTNFFVSILITVLCFSATSVLNLSVAYSEPLKIAVLPFEINSEQNLDFLKNGIQDMLASRLSFKDQVIVIDKESVKRVSDTVKGFSGESFALLVGGQLKADFVIYGSVTVIGTSTSIDSKLLDISGKNPPIPFFRESSDPGGVIPAINQFATTINETLFNRAAGKADNNIATSSPSATPLIQPQPNHTTNINPQFSSKASQMQSNQAQSLNPEFAVTNTPQGKSGAWRSPTFKNLINAIAIGDTDKDGLMETVFISDKSVFIYSFANNHFIKKAETPKNSYSTYIGVGIGDINSNGFEEIFVTSMNADKNMPNSFVIEYDGSKYREIIKNSPWYFRIVETNGGDKILLGQKQKSDKDTIYSSPIYVMRWDGEQYQPSEKILEANKANVMGALFADVIGDGSPKVVAYDRYEYLTIFSQSGSVIWRDANRTGGNMNYFELPKESPTDDNPLQYFPLSVSSFDINGDGVAEILYASNSDIVGGYLSRFKRYSKGIVHSSFWNGGSGLSLQWSTPEQRGRVSDFVIGDFDNDGKKELLIANVVKDALSSFSDSESLIISYELME